MRIRICLQQSFSDTEESCLFSRGFKQIVDWLGLERIGSRQSGCFVSNESDTPIELERSAR